MAAMTATTTSKHGVARVLVGLVLAASACGDSADDAGSAPAGTKPKAATAAGVDLTPMLMRADEEPGFRPGALPDAMPRSRETFTGVNAFAQEMRLPPAEVRRLRSEGFVAFTVGPIRGPRNTAGLTNAALYETAEGAKRSMAHDKRPDVIRAYGPVENLRFFRSREFRARGAGRRPSLMSPTSCGCRAAATSRSETRAPAASRAACRRACRRSTARTKGLCS